MSQPVMEQALVSEKYVPFVPRSYEKPVYASTHAGNDGKNRIETHLRVRPDFTQRGPGRTRGNSSPKTGSDARHQKRFNGRRNLHPGHITRRNGEEEYSTGPNENIEDVLPDSRGYLMSEDPVNAYQSMPYPYGFGVNQSNQYSPPYAFAMQPFQSIDFVSSSPFGQSPMIIPNCQPPMQLAGSMMPSYVQSNIPFVDHSMRSNQLQSQQWMFHQFPSMVNPPSPLSADGTATSVPSLYHLYTMPTNGYGTSGLLPLTNRDTSPLYPDYYSGQAPSYVSTNNLPNKFEQRRNSAPQSLPIYSEDTVMKNSRRVSLDLRQEEQKVHKIWISPEDANELPIGPVHNRTIFLGNLSSDTTVAKILDIFGAVGRIEKVNVFVPKNGKGYCSRVSFFQPESCELAVQRFHRSTVDGTKINVSLDQSFEQISDIRNQYFDDPNRDGGLFSIRSWIYAPEMNKSSEAPSFSVATYNFLSQKKLLTSFGSESVQNRSKLYPKFTWRYRAKSIISELQAYDSDIICIQEAEGWSGFQGSFSLELDRLGYATWTIDEKYVREGLALAYKKSLFSCIAHGFHKFERVLPQKPFRNITQPYRHSYTPYLLLSDVSTVDAFSERDKKILQDFLNDFCTTDFAMRNPDSPHLNELRQRENVANRETEEDAPMFATSWAEFETRFELPFYVPPQTILIASVLLSSRSESDRDEHLYHVTEHLEVLQSYLKIKHPDGSTGPIAVILGGDFGDSVEPCSLGENSRKSSDLQSYESDEVVNSKTAENGKLLIDVHPSPTECLSESSPWQDAYTCASKEYVPLSTYLPDGSSITSDYIFFKGPLQIHRVLQVPDRSDLQEPHERQESKVAEDMHLLQANDQMNSLTIEKQRIASGPRRKSAADSPADYRTAGDKEIVIERLLPSERFSSDHLALICSFSW